MPGSGSPYGTSFRALRVSTTTRRQEPRSYPLVVQGGPRMRIVRPERRHSPVLPERIATARGAAESVGLSAECECRSLCSPGLALDALVDGGFGSRAGLGGVERLSAGVS